MSKYKYILFDLDGTLTRSHYGIFNCFRYALQKMGVTEEPTEETLKKCLAFVEMNKSKKVLILRF